MASKEIKGLRKAVSKMEEKMNNTAGRMVKLPNAAPNYYRRPFHCTVKVNLSNNGTDILDWTPYKLLNNTKDVNKDLLLKFTALQLEYLDVFVTGSRYFIIEFPGLRAIQSTQSGNPDLVAIGKNAAGRMEVFPVGATGSVTARRIYPPELISGEVHDTTDKVTTLFTLQGSESSTDGYVFVSLKMTGYSYFAPEVLSIGDENEAIRRQPGSDGPVDGGSAERRRMWFRPSEQHLQHLRRTELFPSLKR